MNKLTPFLWFESKAEEAADYYVSLFPNSKILSTVMYPKSAEEVSGQKAGSVMTVDLEIDGTHFQFLNGGKGEGFDLHSSAISFVITCKTQEEIDRYWQALSAVPQMEQCGWCKDKFGITWQIVPEILGKYMTDPDKEKVERVTKAFMPMKKLVISELEKAYNQT